MSRSRADVPLWMDDCKPAPDGFAVARTYDAALALCRRYEYPALYLDHDIGDDGRTGLHLLRQLRSEGICPAMVHCISWNPAGRAAIIAEANQPPTGAEGGRDG